MFVAVPDFNSIIALNKIGELDVRVLLLRSVPQLTNRCASIPFKQNKFRLKVKEGMEWENSKIFFHIMIMI